MSVIGIDAGTSAVKGGLFSSSGELLAESSAEAFAVLPERGDGSRGADAEAYLSAAICVLKDLSPAVPSVDPLQAISVSGNGPTLVPVAENGCPAGDALLWTDRRAAAEAERASRTAGMTIDPAFYLPKVLWLLAHPETMPRPASWFSALPEYIAFRLSGVPHAVLPDPRYAPFIWNKALTEALGVPPGALPPLIPPGSLLGAIRTETARECGLPEACQIVSGLPDFLAAQIGSACTRPGLALDRAGSSEVLNLCAQRPFPDRRIFSLPHAVSPLWNLSGGLSTSGAALDWLSSLLSPGTGFPSDAELKSAGSGSRGLIFLPYLAGERAPLWDANIRGAFIGLSTIHERKHLFRALMESVAFALRDVMEILDERGFPVEELRVTGGPASNAFWCALKAQVLNRRISVPSVGQAELLGSAAICLGALGHFSSAAEAAEAIYRPRAEYDPPDRPDPLIEGAYAAFLVARGSLAPVSRALSAPGFR